MNVVFIRRGALGLVLCLSILVTSVPVHAASFSDTIRGRILLDVQGHGEAWYVAPDSLQRYYLAQKEDAYSIMRSLGLGVTNADLAKLPVAMSQVSGDDSDRDGLADPLEIGLGTDPYREDSDGDSFTDATEITNNFNPLGTGTRTLDYAMLRRLSGRILLQVEGHGEAWYIHPVNLKRYYLGQPEDAYTLMRNLSLGITTSDLARVAVAKLSLAAPAPAPLQDADGITFEKKTISMFNQNFTVSILRLDRSKVKMVTRTANVSDCIADCPAKTVKEYVEEAGALAGVNGSYFCPPDYANCATHLNSYDPPFFHSGLDTMINEEKIKFHNRPMVMGDAEGGLRYFHRPDTFGNSVSEFENSSGTQLAAGFGSWPSLIENGENVYASEPVEAAFSKKGRRAAFGWTDTELIVVITDSATMAESAEIVHSLGVTYAVNIDGGASSALYVDGAYKINGGRLVPNAILFQAK